MATYRCRVASVALLLGVYFFSTVTLATPGQPGTLDLTFNGTGKIMTPGGVGDEQASALVVQPDGKLVLAGTCFNGTNDDFCGRRYNANGTLDVSFGSGGSVMTSIGTGNDAANAAVLQPDGKLVLAGHCFDGTNQGFCALRYLANGTLDTSFGSSGKVSTPGSMGTAYASALALQPDGKLVLAGFCTGATHFGFCALRYLANGSLDASFGSGGTVITQFGTGGDYANVLALQADGKLVLAGGCFDGTKSIFCALRYLANGTLDASFGSGGKVSTPIGTSDAEPYAMALQPDGKLVLTGYCSNGTNADFCTVRYNTDGTPDATFGSSGSVMTPVGAGEDIAHAVAVQPDGKLVLAGYCSGATNFDFCALRYHTNGTVDTSFGSGGTVITPVGARNDIAYAVALQPDGKLVLAGSCYDGAKFYFCAIRYEGGPFGYKNCSLDIDGDNRVLAMTDSLVHTRIALGITGPAVVNGITFPLEATRKTWPLIRNYLVTQCGMSLVL